jgi:hypothetical protein
LLKLRICQLKIWPHISRDEHDERPGPGAPDSTGSEVDAAQKWPGKMTTANFHIEVFMTGEFQLPAGKRLHNYGKSSFLLGKSTN